MNLSIIEVHSPTTNLYYTKGMETKKRLKATALLVEKWLMPTLEKSFPLLKQNKNNITIYLSYIGDLINDMKLESSQFIYYPKRAELLFT
jgi:hypothetical protein